MSSSKAQFGTGMNSRRRGVPSSEPVRKERRDFIEHMQEYARQGGLDKPPEVVSVDDLLQEGKPVENDFSAALAMAEASLQVRIYIYIYMCVCVWAEGSIYLGTFLSLSLPPTLTLLPSFHITYTHRSQKRRRK